MASPKGGNTTAHINTLHQRLNQALSLGFRSSISSSSSLSLSLASPVDSPGLVESIDVCGVKASTKACGNQECLKMVNMCSEHLVKNIVRTIGKCFLSLGKLEHDQEISVAEKRMDRVIFLLLIASAFIAVSAAISGETEDAFDNPIRQVVPKESDEHLLNAEHHFSLFKSKYEKAYATKEEHDRRFRVFRANLRRARRHQLLDPSAEHGVTQFSDLTPKEFRRRFLGLKRRLRLPTDTQTAPILPTSDLPEEFDWREQGAVTPVKNQGSCGSCWSFSAVGALEGAHFLATKKLVSLSEQQLVDCDHECDPEQANSCDSGCGGGLMNNAFEYTLKSGGLMKEEDYPYTGHDNTACKFDKNAIAAKVSNFSVVSADEDQIAANLVTHGPLAIAINAMWMQTYIGGVSCPYVCSKSQDHGVLLVGFGSAGYAPIRLKEKPYWIIKNSWGSMWGEHGYYKICRGRHNICGMDTMVSTVAAVHTSPQ